MPTYKGKLAALNNPDKYTGDVKNITYRSMWERNVMKWCDDNPEVLEWASEDIAIPYVHPVTGKRARYYPDFYIKFKDGVIKVVEVKPKKETVAPASPTRKSKKWIEETARFAINAEKWKNAQIACSKNGLRFEIWTEETLQKMGILKWEAEKSQLLAERRLLKRKETTKRKPYTRPTRRS